jgi:3-oxo-5-alpha-steroid 4-dehydrogenase 3
VYLFAWINQYQCHKHLAGLKKYSLPSQGLFRFLLCPHYTCECLLYLSMAVAGAPEGAWYNRTLLCGLAFVVTNLSVTAAGTRKWYVDKFGADSINDKWNMIPLLF